MTHPSRSIRVLASVAGLALAPFAVAACGGGGATASTTPPKASTPATSVGTTSTALGTILVDSQGRTLYLFTHDSGSTSLCTGACATAWPPLVANGTSTAADGDRNHERRRTVHPAARRDDAARPHHPDLRRAGLRRVRPTARSDGLRRLVVRSPPRTRRLRRAQAAQARNRRADSAGSTKTRRNRSHQPAPEPEAHKPATCSAPKAEPRLKAVFRRTTAVTGLRQQRRPGDGDGNV